MRTLPFALLGCLWMLALAPSAAAQYTYQASGLATKDGVVYRIGLTRHPDAVGFPTLGLGITQRAPTAENLFDMTFVEQTWFYVVDNFNTSPSSTATPYFAVATDPSVDFAFNGYQVGHMVNGHGHYKGYEFVLTMDVGV
jgi:hypothetical protein